MRWMQEQQRVRRAEVQRVRRPHAAAVPGAERLRGRRRVRAGAGGLRRTREAAGERVVRPMREAVHEPRRERGASSACCLRCAAAYV